jgi:KDO2-lipid IV(A) lauroyltransferase
MVLNQACLLNIHTICLSCTLKTCMSDSLIPLLRFWQPRYWLTWFGLLMLRLIVMLPQSWRMACGRVLGRAARRFAPRRSIIVSRNLELCFPELTAEDREIMNIRHFESLGMTVIEMGMSWWCSDRELEKLIVLRDVENLRAANEAGHGVLMFGGHFATTEITGRILRPIMPPMALMYRPSDSPLNDQIVRRCRLRSAHDLITKDEVRRLLRILKQNRAVWYASDQAYTGKGMVLAPFFGVPATTNTSASQIARVSKAKVVPYLPRRLNNGKSYELVFLPALENFPGESPEADAARLNKLLEDHIRKAPEQYYWVHRRFKGRPEEFPDPYK